MNSRLYLFNPDHDLALANGDENFNPPQSARTFASDLACLPIWYAFAESVVWNASADQIWMEEMRQLFPRLADLSMQAQPDFSTLTSVHPWGWDSAVVKRLIVQGAGDSLLPGMDRLNAVRRLSHRATAIKALRFLRGQNSLADLLPFPAQQLSIDEVERFAAYYPAVIFKAPWSGSGKGLCWSHGAMTESKRGWCRNIAEKQGCVIGEEAYDKVQDFAMEFSCLDGKATFAGYSLFETERGIYRSNELSSDEDIFKRLTEKWVSAEDLLTVQHCLLSFLENEIAPFYTGLLGVDMFVFRRDGAFRLHPCVEINVRMTMGGVARIFYDRFVQPSATGRFFIDHYPSSGSLWQDHQQRRSLLPLQVVDGQIAHGYLSLSPVTQRSHYRVRVEIR